MKRTGIQAVHGETEAVADHGADQGAFDSISCERHASAAERAKRPPYQSRQVRVGKRDDERRALAATWALVAAYAAAAWFRQPALLLMVAAPLLWRIPFEHRWLTAPPGAALRAGGDAGLLTLAWLLATWALWQHRTLPFVICVAAVALLLADRTERRLAFPRRAGIL